MGTENFVAGCVTIGLMASSLKLARPAGVEPTTYSFGNCHSIQMSYGRFMQKIAMRLKVILHQPAQMTPSFGNRYSIQLSYERVL